MDESRYVDIVANRFQTIAHRITPDPQDFLDRMAQITWHQDIPTGSSGVYTQNFVMKLAHGNVTVLLDGQGADELLAGYLSYVVYHLNDLRKRDFGRWIGEQARFCRRRLGALQRLAQRPRIRLPRPRVSRRQRAAAQPPVRASSVGAHPLRSADHAAGQRRA